MNHRVWMLALVMVFAAFAGCQKKNVYSSALSTANGEIAKPGSALAYEHSVEIEMDAARVVGRVEAVRSACNDARFGSCSVLALDQSGGARVSASITVRMVPGGVEPLVVLAAEGGKTASRMTRAEDMADAVVDASQQIAMLTAQRSTLFEFRSRKDLTVADMIALSGELAAIETRLQSAVQASAGHQRRIETNLLTLRFSAPYESESRISRIGSAFAGLLDGATDGLSEALELLGYGIPFLLLAFPLALIWRLLWRRFTRVRGA